MRLVMEGATEFARKLEAVSQATPQAVIGALYQSANQIMTAAKRDYVPVDTGALRASGFVEDPVFLGVNASITMGFGGPSAPYAVIVHEDLTKRHRVGQAKYLELPFRAAIQGMRAVLNMRVADSIRQSFQRSRNVEANIRAGRNISWGMPLFRGAT